MRAVIIRAPGGPEQLVLADRPDPVPAPTEVLVAVAAAGVNRPDVLQRRGLYPPPPGVTDIPGLELAGRVVAVGDAVRRWRVGDTVCAIVAGGAYAERCVVPEGQCLPVPAGLSLVEAAALPEAALTVWGTLVERGALTAGQSVLVHGGSSGIGTMAIALATARGARVFATAGSAAKCAACETLGAEYAVNYHEEEFVAAVRARTDGRGVDVVLDIVGGAYTARNLDVLADDGRLVQVGVLGGSQATVSLMPILQKRLTVTGATLRPRAVAHKARLAREVERHVWPLVASGRVRPPVHAVFPLSEAAAAHALMESSAHIGKLVLQLQSRA